MVFLILKKKFFIFLNKNFNNILNLKSPYIEKAIFESCKIKKIIVEKDEKEKNIRKTLNFGHTFAHSYEASLGYSKKLNHGEAVILGMITALKFSFKKKLLKKNEFYFIKKHFEKMKLPHDIKKYFSSNDLDKILKFMIKDKKNISNNINLILLRKIGSTIIDKEYKKQSLNLFLKDQLFN